MGIYRRFFKRFFDIVIALIGLIILSPLFLILWILLSIANKGAGAFFFQERPGKHERIFKVIKFKTMTDERDAKGNLLPDAGRLFSQDWKICAINISGRDSTVIERNKRRYVAGRSTSVTRAISAAIR